MRSFLSTLLCLLCVLVVMPGVVAQQGPSIDILSPDENSYISGSITMSAKLMLANTPIERISFFADGKLICAVEQVSYVCN